MTGYVQNFGHFANFGHISKKKLNFKNLFPAFLDTIQRYQKIKFQLPSQYGIHVLSTPDLRQEIFQLAPRQKFKQNL